jgi:hypothetical protein
MRVIRKGQSPGGNEFPCVSLNEWVERVVFYDENYESALEEVKKSPAILAAASDCACATATKRTDAAGENRAGDRRTAALAEQTCECGR